MLELQVKDRLNKFGAVVLTYDLWISRGEKQKIPMTAYHCEVLEHGFFYLGMLNTTCTGGQIIANAVNLLLKSLVLKEIFSDSPATEVQTWKSARLYLET